jgi:hypothetical protein
MDAKLVDGGLGHHIPTMRHLTLSAERALMEYAVINPALSDTVLNQILSVVRGHCSEAYHNAMQSGSPFGRRMLTDVMDRLRREAENRPDMIAYQTYECLMGVAGLLTGDCEVWWGLKFELEGHNEL